MGLYGCLLVSCRHLPNVFDSPWVAKITLRCFIFTVGRRNHSLNVFTCHWSSNSPCIISFQSVVTKFDFPKFSLHNWVLNPPFIYLFFPPVDSLRLGFPFGRVSFLIRSTNIPWSTRLG
jgi:hypothetical protein